MGAGKGEGHSRARGESRGGTAGGGAGGGGGADGTDGGGGPLEATGETPWGDIPVRAGPLDGVDCGLEGRPAACKGE